MAKHTHSLARGQRLDVTIESYGAGGEGVAKIDGIPLFIDGVFRPRFDRGARYRAVTDFNRQRIYNWTTYTAFLWAVAISVVATLTASSGESLAPAFESAPVIGPHWLGGIGIGECLAGAAVCFFVLMFGYDLSGGGAGDVKLATVIGALLGLHDGIFAVGYSYVVAFIVILAWSTWKNGPLALVRAGVRTVGKFLGPLWPFHSTTEDRKLLLTPVPLGPYFLIGTLLVFFGLVPT